MAAVPVVFERVHFHQPYHPLHRSQASSGLSQLGKLTHGWEQHPDGTFSQSFTPYITKDGFIMTMDVSQFAPSDITVKTFDHEPTTTVIVEGKQNECEDAYGTISRHFYRRFSLPHGYEKVTSTLSSDGILVVKSPPPAKGTERIVSVQQVGPMRESIK